MTENRNGLPLGWEMAEVGSLVTLVNGYAFKPLQWTETGLPIIRIQNLNKKTAEFNHFSGNLPEKYLVKQGDLLFAWSGTPGTSFGAHVWRQGDAWLNQHIFRVDFNREWLDYRFLKLAINRNLDEYIHAAHGGAGLSHITKGNFESSVLLIPPLAEQRRIVEAIETQFTRLDAAVAALERARANLKRYRASVLKAACEGRLVPTEAELFGSSEGGRTPVDRPDGIGPDLELPAGWDWRISSDICSSIESGNTPPAEQMSSSGEIPFIKIYNLTRDGRLDFSVRPTFVSRATHDRQLRRSRILPNDVLMNIVGPPLGKVSLVPDTFPEWNTNQAVVVFRAGSEMLPRFLAYLLLSETIQRTIAATSRATAGQFNVSLSTCRRLVLPLPPISEQQRIVAEVERRLSGIERMEATIANELRRAERLRQAILREAFAGRLVPQDPADEPASTLLERIRAERAAAPVKPKRGRAKGVTRLPL